MKYLFDLIIHVVFLKNKSKIMKTNSCKNKCNKKIKILAKNKKQNTESE